jgi:hypothetical protein
MLARVEIGARGMKNQFCESDSLGNEAGVEQNFVRRLLQDLGYSDAEILPKRILDALVVGGMRGQCPLPASGILKGRNDFQ